ncbi:hypothetical protein GYMLUDRAFT_245551 [Collybiopsis luxurians FD-317 M1]|uniref:Uncharacterized protein n=1 Tax=Collybiopsis luxurians FD-317 M1 TaxID=944289 RepID=A0A0D0B6R5_9AGAR|nr:hypothetical protein GYMLUDRAFT_245551 [Collybiopsis luxurians FD-317 M1]
MRSIKKTKKLLSNLQPHKGQKTTVPQAGSTPELGNVAQDSRNPGGSVSNVSVMSDSIQGRLPENLVSDSGQPLVADAQSAQQSSNRHQALQTAGAVAETGLKILQELSKAIPVAGPGLGAALGVVSECIEIYHQVAQNKESFKELTEELSARVAEVKEYMEQSGPTEMEGIYQSLAEYGSVVIVGEV